MRKFNKLLRLNSNYHKSKSTSRREEDHDDEDDGGDSSDPRRTVVSSRHLQKMSMYPCYGSWAEKLKNIPDIQQFHEDFVLQRVIAEGGEGKLVQIKARKTLAANIKQTNGSSKVFAAKYVRCSSSTAKKTMQLQIKQMEEYELMQTTQLLNYYRIYHYSATVTTALSSTPSSAASSSTTSSSSTSSSSASASLLTPMTTVANASEERRQQQQHNNNNENASTHNNNDNNQYVHNYNNDNTQQQQQQRQNYGYRNTNANNTNNTNANIMNNDSGNAPHITTTQEWMIIVSQLLYKSLTQYVLAHKNDINEEKIKPIMKSVVQHLSILHKHNFIHLDLRPDNIMCVNRGKNKTWKIIDFGFREKIYTASNHTKSGVKWKGIFGFTAPEFSVYISDYNTNQLSFSADIWVIGMLILYCIFCGQTSKLFPDSIYSLMLDKGGNNGNIDIQTEVMDIWYQYLHDPNQGFRTVVRNIRNGVYAGSISATLQDLLINHLLIYDPNFRANNCDTLLKHAWFQ